MDQAYKVYRPIPGKFGDCSFSRFDSMGRTDTRTDTHTDTKRFTHATVVGVSNQLFDLFSESSQVAKKLK